jgi:hypothetical protein
MDRGLFLFIATSSKLANLQEAIIVNPLASYSRIA